MAPLAPAPHGRDRSEQVVAIRRNRWSRSSECALHGRCGRIHHIVCGHQPPKLPTVSATAPQRRNATNILNPALPAKHLSANFAVYRPDKSVRPAMRWTGWRRRHAARRSGGSDPRSVKSTTEFGFDGLNYLALALLHPRNGRCHGVKTCAPALKTLAHLDKQL